MICFKKQIDTDFISEIPLEQSTPSDSGEYQMKKKNILHQLWGFFLLLFENSIQFF